MNSSSRADTDSVLAGGIQMFISESITLLDVFKYLYQYHCNNNNWGHWGHWGHLNV